MLFVRHIQQQMKNTGLMVNTMISPKTEKQKTKKQVMGIMAMGQQQAVMNLQQMVTMQAVVSQHQLASLQVVHDKAH